MRTPMVALVAFLYLVHGALAEDPPPLPAFSQNPVTEDFLRDLDFEQLAILRRAIRGCPKIGRIRSERDPCVTSSTDRAIADSENPDLIAFHKALHNTDRYDETRSSIVWRSWLTKR